MNRQTCLPSSPKISTERTPLGKSPRCKPRLRLAIVAPETGKDEDWKHDSLKTITNIRLHPKGMQRQKSSCGSRTIAVPAISQPGSPVLILQSCRYRSVIVNSAGKKPDGIIMICSKITCVINLNLHCFPFVR